jgi:hypothetical protein
MATGCDYATDAFTVTPDTLGDTDVTLAPVLPCFAAGPRIRTPAGFMAVGDRVVTLSSVSKPIGWIGHRRVVCRRHPDPAAVRPIRIRAHAFGPGLPGRIAVVILRERGLETGPGINVVGGPEPADRSSGPRPAGGTNDKASVTDDLTKLDCRCNGANAHFMELGSCGFGK